MTLPALPRGPGQPRKLMDPSDHEILRDAIRDGCGLRLMAGRVNDARRAKQGPGAQHVSYQRVKDELEVMGYACVNGDWEPVEAPPKEVEQLTNVDVPLASSEVKEPGVCEPFDAPPNVEPRAPPTNPDVPIASNEVKEPNSHFPAQAWLTILALSIALGLLHLWLQWRRPEDKMPEPWADLEPTWPPTQAPVGTPNVGPEWWQERDWNG